jgi:hypothetical protein
MKLAKKNNHKRDRYVREDPDYENNHIYLIRGQSHIEKGYKSVTTYIKQFFSEFDADGIIDKYYDKWQSNNHEKYAGKSKDEIKQMWEDNRDDAATKGTYMHRQFELYNNDEIADTTIEEFNNFFVWDMDRDLMPYRTEMTVYYPKYKLVGNIDLIVDNGDGTYDIIDYKRTDKNPDASFGRYCKEPLRGYPDNDATKHALQLSVYKKILEDKYDLKINKLWNLYIKGDDHCNFVEREYIEIDNFIN